MNTYAIDDGFGNQITAGLAEYEVEKIAKILATDRGEPVYFYEMGGEGEYTKVMPSRPAKRVRKRRSR